MFFFWKWWKKYFLVRIWNFSSIKIFYKHFFKKKLRKISNHYIDVKFSGESIFASLERFNKYYFTYFRKPYVDLWNFVRIWRSVGEYPQIWIWTKRHQIWAFHIHPRWFWKFEQQILREWKVMDFYFTPGTILQKRSHQKKKRIIEGGYFKTPAEGGGGGTE